MTEGIAVELNGTDSAQQSAPANPSLSADQAVRETIESIIVAVILAFLFRTFVAEAFVIPTGSMAPSLQGRHMDVACSECGYRYRTGATIENTDAGREPGEVKRTRCPICRYSMALDKDQQPNHRSFNGDRIIVSKFAYGIAEPQRWDVIVFKFPGKARLNYIKRLVGLPGETIRIRHGDIYTLDPATADQPQDQQKFTIARKPPEKVVAMLQLVDDTKYIAERLRNAYWPSRWTQASKVGPSEEWQMGEAGERFRVAAGADASWLHYRHLLPRPEDWLRIARNEPPELDGYGGQLITDYYAYNDSDGQMESSSNRGDCWVGDLAVECEVEVQRHSGEVLLELVEGGTRYRCTIDVESGRATLMIDGGNRSFVDASGRSTTRPAAKTDFHGPGKYFVRFANVDDQLFLWVDGRVAKFDAPTTFQSPENPTPQWSQADPGDLSPVRVGARQTQLEIVRLGVLRDIYYRAAGPIEPYRNSDNNPDYDRAVIGYDFDVAGVLADPQSWSRTPLFGARRSAQFKLDADQFFPLGDNSPVSQDARVWSDRRFGSDEFHPPPYVSRELLIGKALIIYWPHSWRVGTRWLPIMPNFQRMGLIR